MKILRIISSTDPGDGGVIESVLQSSNSLLDFGFDVEILSLDASDSSWLGNSRINIIAKGPSYTCYALSLNFSRWLNLNHSKYDIFIIEGIWQYHSIATHYILTKNNRPYYVFTHGMLDPWFKYKYPLKHLKKWLFWPWGDYRVLRDAEKVLFTSQQELESSRKSFWLYNCNEKVVPIGIKRNCVEKENSIDLFLSKYPNLKNKKFFLFLSRINPKKGLDILIESFSNNISKFPNHYLVIAGPDTIGYKKSLLKIAQKYNVYDKIIWTGMLTGKIKWGAYYSAEAFILPSHQENFGIVVAEALSCGLPTLISDKVNIHQEISNSCAGLVEKDTILGCDKLLFDWATLSMSEKNTYRENAINCFNNNFEVSNACKLLIDTITN